MHLNSPRTGWLGPAALDRALPDGPQNHSAPSTISDPMTAATTSAQRDGIFVELGKQAEHAEQEAADKGADQPQAEVAPAPEAFVVPGDEAARERASDQADDDPNDDLSE